MEKYSDIVQFSRDLYLHYTEMPIPQKERDLLNPPRFIQSVECTLGYFCDAFCSKLNRMYDLHISQVRDSDEQLLRYVIPRCLKLVDDEAYHFSFMLVAAFIGELANHLEYHRRCYRFSGTMYRCLVAVFKRRFEATFQQNGGWRGLRAYCDSVNRTVWSQKKQKPLSRVLTGFDRDYRRRVLDIIKQCDLVEDECFALNSYELSLIAADDIMTKEAELYKSTSSADESPLQVEWTMVKDNEIIKVSSTFDSEKGMVSSTCIRGADSSVGKPVVLEETSLVSEPPVVLKEASLIIEPPVVLKEAGLISEPSVVLKEAGLISEPAVVLKEADLVSEPPVVLKETGQVSEPPVVLEETSLVSEPPVVLEEASLIDELPVVLEETSLIAELPMVLEEASLVSEPPVVLEEASLVSEPPVVREAESSDEVILEDPDEYSESDSDENSDSESDDSEFSFVSELSDTTKVPDVEDVIHGGFADHVAYLLQPTEYDQKLSAHVCKWCDKRCFQIAKYFFIKHRDLSLKPKRLRRTKFILINSLKSIGKLFSRHV